MKLVLRKWKESLFQLHLFFWLFRGAVKCEAFRMEGQSCMWVICNAKGSGAFLAKDIAYWVQVPGAEKRRRATFVAHHRQEALL